MFVVEYFTKDDGSQSLDAWGGDLRAVATDTLRSPVDVAIIGGGINGCGIARDASGRGWSVFLCEKGDLAGATSSAASKLIHVACGISNIISRN